MKKSVAVVVAVAAAIAVSASAQLAEKPESARAALEAVRAYVEGDIRSNHWVNAAEHVTRLEQVIRDFSDAPRDVMKSMQLYRVCYLLRSGDYAGAIDAGEAVLRDYADVVTESDRANAYRLIGNSHERLGDVASAQSAYERGLTDNPGAKWTERFAIHRRLVRLFEKRGEKAAAQAAYMAIVTNYAWYFSAPDEKSEIWRAFDRVNPTLLSTADYRAFLEATLKATRATEENARFLGRVKSELEKIK